MLCLLRAQALFLLGGMQMIAAEVVIAALLGAYFKGALGDHVPSDVGIGILIVVCIFVSGFAYSWGPLGWLVSAPHWRRVLVLAQGWGCSFGCAHPCSIRLPA